MGLCLRALCKAEYDMFYLGAMPLIVADCLFVLRWKFMVMDEMSIVGIGEFVLPS